MSVSVLEFWLSSLNMSSYHQTFIDNGYDDLEISKKIGASDLTAMGVTRSDHRARILQAVADLVLGGATQVYIRAASLHWKILDEKEIRIIPANLLRKMIKMKIKTEGIRLVEFTPNQHKDILPLNLVYLCHRFSLCLSTQQQDIEAVVEELWKEEWENQFSIQQESAYENFSTKSPSLFSTFQHPSRLSTTACPRSVSAQFSSSPQQQQKISNFTQHPKQSRFMSSQSSDCSPSSSSSPITSSDYEYPRLSCLSSSRLQDSSISTSSSMDSLSCLLSSIKMRQTPTMKHSETSVDSFKKQFDKVRSHSKLVNSGRIYCVDSQVHQKLW